MQLEAPRGLWKKRPNADSNRFANSIYIYIYILYIYVAQPCNPPPPPPHGHGPVCTLSDIVDILLADK